VNAGAKLGGFGLALVAVLGAGAAVGQVAGPVDTSTGAEAHEVEHSADAGNDTHDAVPAGLQVSQDGYTFVPTTRSLSGGRLTFAVVGPDGEPVTRFDVLHDRRLHLILASRDLRQYAHLHPTMAPDGTWSVEVPTLAAGAYRAFADVQPTGAEHVTLGIDMSVPGPLEPTPTLTASDRDEVDGFEVDLSADEDGTVTVTVRRDGEVVTTEPYLGAAGHLVALRDGDLAYLHVHPLDEEPAGPVRFGVEYPSEGRYALFFDFQVDGTVHTARFVVEHLR
jgi:hypothetical protein